MILTNEQKEVIKKSYKDIISNKHQYITISGYAGTGKSTVAKFILDVLANKGINLAPCAFTGKATNVLRKKGMNSNTIHSLIYSPYKNEKEEVIWYLTNKNDLIYKGIDGFLVDEASMISKEIHDDLISFGLPIIYIGDHGQLEPIGTKFNLMENPMYKLETVHRNAGEIAYFAEHLRKGNRSDTFKAEDKVQIVTDDMILPKHLSNVDQVICAFNKTRQELNQKVREEKGIEMTYITKGEKIICLKNNKKLGLFNGMQGIVKKVYKNERIDFISEGILFEKIRYHPDQFGQEKNIFEFSDEKNPFDYSYAITAHKSQGDEFGSVIAYEQNCDAWDHKKWNYTVASRAKKSLIWIAKKTFIPTYMK